MPHTQTSGCFLCFNSFHPRSKKSGCTLPSQTAPTNRFTFNFPIKFTGTYRMPLFHFLMACAVEIVSRTFLHALGISNSLKLLFQARRPPSSPVAGCSMPRPLQIPHCTCPRPLLIPEGKGTAVTCLLGEPCRPPLSFRRGSRASSRCRSKVKEETCLEPHQHATHQQ